MTVVCPMINLINVLSNLQTSKTGIIIPFSFILGQVRIFSLQICPLKDQTIIFFQAFLLTLNDQGSLFFPLPSDNGKSRCSFRVSKTFTCVKLYATV